VKECLSAFEGARNRRRVESVSLHQFYAVGAVNARQIAHECAYFQPAPRGLGDHVRANAAGRSGHQDGPHGIILLATPIPHEAGARTAGYPNREDQFSEYWNDRVRVSLLCEISTLLTAAMGQER